MFASMLAFGFLLGVRHSLEADHVAAVAALSTRTTSLRGLLGLAAGWGTGHSLTILAVGTGVVALGARLPGGSEAMLERLVGAVLVVMGCDVIRRAVGRRLHAHAHEHDDRTRHVHLHLHAAPAAQLAAPHDLDHDHDHFPAGTGRALAMGTLHGMAGSAALLLLLPPAGSSLAAVAGLAVFGVGSIAGMMLFSLALSFPLRAATRFAGATAGLEGALGAATVLVGLRIVTA